MEGMKWKTYFIKITMIYNFHSSPSASTNILVVRFPASRPPIPGSNLAPGSLHSAVWGAACDTVYIV